MIDFNAFLKKILNKKLSAKFLQYRHRGSCQTPCVDCPEKDKRVYENGLHVAVPAHPHCDCYYEDVKTKKVGTVSELGINGPDGYLKMFGELPDYYITKDEAINKYGWDNSKNTIAGKAPGKMIGGDIYYNDKHILPEKEGRIWYECDVDYKFGKRSKLRLYYSNDGLMFFSPDHLYYNVTVYYVE